MNSICTLLRFFLDHPAEQFIGREVAHKTGVEERSCYRHLKRLADEGILVCEARAYRFNAKLARNIFRAIKFSS
ncbi:MAG: hypothetical protein J0L53_18475 [Spirochaetes bacterium]|nr:hypothetical protein [Spirochaetota bacterium]